MANIVSQLIVKLVDQISGPAAKSAKSLQDVEKAANSIGKTRDLSSGILRELEKIRAAPKQIDAIRQSWDNFQNGLKAAGPIKADHFLRLHKDWHSDTMAKVRSLKRESEGMSGSMARGVGAFTAVAPRMIGGYAAWRTIKAGIKAGADNAREDTRDSLAGYTLAESIRLRAGAASMSSKYQSMDFASAHERLRDVASSVGDIEKALSLSDTIGAGNTVLQSLKGPQAAIEESRKFFKALDTLGKNVDAGEVRSLYDGYIKAVGVEGADMNMGDIFTLAKRAKSGQASLSNKFLMSIAPSLMQDMGPDRVGTAIGSMVSQIVGGRATKESKSAQTKFGLRDKDGAFSNQRMLLSDPFEYTNKVLIPALQKKGIDTNDNEAVVAAMSQLFSNQSVADLFTKLITQGLQYARKSEQYAKAPGLDAAKSLPSSDLYVASESFVAQLRNLGAELSRPFTAPLIASINGLASALNWLAIGAKNSPEATEKMHKETGGFPELGVDPTNTGFPQIGSDLSEEHRRQITAQAEAEARRKATLPPDNPFESVTDAAAGEVGSATGSSFRENLNTELSAAKRDVSDAVRDMKNMLNFSASPSITPQIKGASTPGKQSSVNNISRQLARRIDDKNIGNFTDNEYA